MEDAVDQLNFEFMLEQAPKIVMNERIKEELVYQMSKAVIEFFQREERKVNDNK